MSEEMIERMADVICEKHKDTIALYDAYEGE